MLFIGDTENIIECFEISYKEDRTKYCYSNKELAVELQNCIIRHKLEKIYTTLYTFDDPNALRWNTVDYVYIGGYAIFKFDNCIIEIVPLGEGMIEYAKYDLNEVSIKHVGCLASLNEPSKFHHEFIDINLLFSMEYENHVVEDIYTELADGWCFDSEGYDEKRAQIALDSKDLPNKVEFKLDNGVVVGICGQSIPGGELYFNL